MMEIEFLEGILAKNGYPVSTLNKYLKPNFAFNQLPYGPEKCPVVLRLPYIGSALRNLNRKFILAFNQSIKQQK